jgi:methyltransferase (TIGR00027 family)
VRREQASLTAQRVAAQRALFARVPADHGDPSADDRLGGDVAGDQPASPQSPMIAYLAARTRFIDSVVVRSLQGGVTQVVTVGAGYDGRALRYAKPGVSWFEVDHPATQADKLERLARLDLRTAGVAFVAADFAVDDVAAGLAAAGQRSEIATLFLCEGVAVYLETDVLERLLRGLRARAAPESRLAISLSVGGASAERRERFRARVAAVGEPVRTVLTTDDAGALLAATGWRYARDPSGDRNEGRAARAGFLVARPV